MIVYWPGHKKKSIVWVFVYTPSCVEVWIFCPSAVYSPNFLCGFSGVVQFNTWLISSWEENKCCYKQRWHLLHSKWLKLSFWVKIVVNLSVAQLVTTVIFFSAWHKSRVKLDNSRDPTKKMRTLKKRQIKPTLYKGK